MTGRDRLNWVNNRKVLNPEVDWKKEEKKKDRTNQTRGQILI